MAEIDYSKWIVDYDPETGIPATNYNVNVGYEYSDSLYNIYKNDLQSSGIDTTPVYAVAGEQTKIANSTYRISLTETQNEYNYQSYKLTFTKQPETDANLYMHAYNPWVSSVSSQTMGYAKWDDDGRAAWINYMETGSSPSSFTSFPYGVSDAVGIGFSDTYSTFLDGRKMLQTMVLYLRVTIMTVYAPGVYQSAIYSPSYTILPYDRFLYEISQGTYSQDLFDKGFEYITENGVRKIRFIVNCDISLYMKAQSAYVQRFEAPFTSMNIGGIPCLYRPLNNGIYSNRTVEIQGQHMYALYDGISYLTLAGTSNFGASQTSYGSNFTIWVGNKEIEAGGTIYNRDVWDSDFPYSTCPAFRKNYFEIEVTGDDIAAHLNQVGTVLDDLDNPDLIAIVQYVAGNCRTMLYPVWTGADIENVVSSYGMYWTGAPMSSIVSAGGDTIETFCTFNGTVTQTTGSGVTYTFPASVRLGTILPTGVTDGTYTVGAANADGIQNEWDDISDSPVTPIDPSIPPDTTDEDFGDIDLSTLPIGGIVNGFITTYVLTDGQLALMGQNLWSDIATTYITNFTLPNGTDYAINYGDIMSFFINARYYPIKRDILESNSAPATSSGVAVGTGAARISIGGDIPRVLNNNPILYNAGTITVPRKYSNFYDYEPYVKALFYAPFCSSVEIPPSLIIGNPLQLYYVFDVLTGNVCAYLYKLSPVRYPIAITSGNVGVDMAMTGNNESTIANKLMSNSFKQGFNLLSGIMSTAATGGFSSIGGIVGGIAGDMSDIYTTQRESKFDNQLKPMVLGTSGDMSGLMQPGNAYIQLRRTNYHNPKTFSHESGFVTERAYLLSPLSGFTVCKNPDLSGISGATASELREIYNALTTGVYL